ncbi:MAG TPA: hypothetical protein VID27_14470 [Blastocatellia bacterium]
MRTEKFYRPLILIVGMLLGFASLARGFQNKRTVETLPDLSGIAWIEADKFLAVHDSKNPKMLDRPRVSIIRLPQSPSKLEVETFDLEWPPPLGPSSDLESIARIPGTGSFLLVESGERIKDRPIFRRIFHARLQGEQLKLISFAEMPASIINIEGTAVARVKDRLLFIYAERADGKPQTDIIWADLQLDPLKLGEPHRATYRPTACTGPGWRPVSAIEIDTKGRLWVASAFDPNDDSGPFQSCIWRIGQVEAIGNGRVALYPRPQLIGRVDGLKIEGLALREQQGRLELFAGADDENYGGALRLIPLNSKRGEGHD